MSRSNDAEIGNLEMREWNFNKDHEGVIRLLEIVFEKELESKGINVKVVFDEFKSIRSLLNFLGIFSKKYKHSMDGFVFENEEGVIVASVTIGYSIFHWEVAMVATHPDYRRRGLARRLVTTAINHAKELGAKLCVLEVLDVNEPAYKLYTSLGFIHFDSITRQKIGFSKLSEIPLVNLPEGYEIRKNDRSKKSNQARYDLDLRVTPEDVQIFHPVDKRKYFKPLLIRMIRPIAKLLLKFNHHEWLIYNEGNPVGHLSVSPSRQEGSPHRIEMMLDPAHNHVLSEPVLAYCLDTLKKNTTIEENILVEFRTSEKLQLENARKLGFVDIETMHRLGLKFEETSK